VEEKVMQMNKLGASGDKLMVISFFFLLSMVGIGVVIGIFIFYGFEYEMREVKADILNLRVRECIEEYGVRESFKDEIFEVCNLNEDVVRSFSRIKVCVETEDCKGSGQYFIKIGDNFEECDIKGLEKNENAAKCSIGETRVGGLKISVVTMDNQLKRRVVVP
jgi:hypothetical protein